MFAMGLRLGEVGIVVLQIFVLVAMTKLTMDVWIVGARLRSFLFNCTFAGVAVVFRALGHGGEMTNLRLMLSDLSPGVS